MLNPMSLAGRQYLVTGASSGLGRDCAVCLSQLGAQVVAVGRNEKALDETMSMLHGDGHTIAPYDLSDVSGIREWLKTLTDRVGTISGLVHFAGYSVSLPVRAVSIDAFEAMHRLHVTAAFELCKHLRGKKIRRAPGAIVLISSVTGVTGNAGMTSYGSAKGAIINLTRALAIEFVRDGIRVNCVAPAMVNTPMADYAERGIPKESHDALVAKHPMGFGEPRDVSNAVAFLLSDAAKWITGTTMMVDGGLTAA